jgi:hypothetical protein
LFDYDKAVTPIVDSMIGDVLRQAINEVQYADELAARDRYQRISYLESTTVNNENLRMEKEDERIRKTIVSALILCYTTVLPPPIDLKIYIQSYRVSFVSTNAKHLAVPYTVQLSEDAIQESIESSVPCAGMKKKS